MGDGAGIFMLLSTIALSSVLGTANRFVFCLALGKTSTIFPTLGEVKTM